MFEFFGLPRNHHCFFCCQYRQPYDFEDQTIYICNACGRVLSFKQLIACMVAMGYGGMRPLKNLRLIGE